MTVFNQSSPLAAYQDAIRHLGFAADDSQRAGVMALQGCFEALQHNAPQPARGVYLWGPVGRGKTWLMDRFYQCLKVPARRQHFHHFMGWVHQRLFQLTGTRQPLQTLAQALSEEIRVLCFDEFFVSDIGDAIILGHLFEAMFEAGVVIVATSNQPPQALYSDGFNRERFLPAIAAIERHMQVVAVDGAQDHRLHVGEAVQRYWVRSGLQPSVMATVFEQLSGHAPSLGEPLHIGSRCLDVVRMSESVLWCRYIDLCEQPLSAMEFMALCDRFKAIMLSEVPTLGASPRAAKIARGTEDAPERVVAGDRELPALSINDNGVRRFIALVDECYDRKVPLYIEAQVPLEGLYTQGYLAFPFRRTLSRLREMQLQRFC